jgi:hypothetical protein
MLILASGSLRQFRLERCSRGGRLGCARSDLCDERLTGSIWMCGAGVKQKNGPCLVRQVCRRHLTLEPSIGLAMLADVGAGGWHGPGCAWKALRNRYFSFFRRDRSRCPLPFGSLPLLLSVQPVPLLDGSKRSLPCWSCSFCYRNAQRSVCATLYVAARTNGRSTGDKDKP